MKRIAPRHSTVSIFATVLAVACAASCASPADAPVGSPQAKTPVPMRVASAGLPEGFVRLRDLAPGVVEDMRYAGADNFTSAPVPGYEAGTCILSRPAAEAMARAAASIEAHGARLVVWDCYRPARAVAAFMAWTASPDQSRKTQFYPRVDKARVVELGYIAARSGHSRGSTVDVGILRAGLDRPPAFDPDAPQADCAAPANLRRDEGVPDFGTGYDCFDPLSHVDAPVSDAAKANRRLLADAMQTAGFLPYAEEWWHFRLAGEPWPDTYFDFPVTAAD